MIAVAGQWKPWTEREVHEIVARSRERNYLSRLLTHMLAVFRWRMIEQDWRRLLSLLAPSK
ncbi:MULTISPECIES: hypothetical protein [Sphingomonadaceae]|jgi:hypothetical protein|uniref:Uncharacterized protein n=1 Tax=Sphingobium baderi TaxID=1332080 RepID=A0A0S3F124_9SPHN|nr:MULTISPECIES: hypothetical protein [Sphingomonadaceae]ALR21379.1 hypothetical protein ATN00_14845 [Sphingobium baderi]